MCAPTGSGDAARPSYVVLDGERVTSPSSPALYPVNMSARPYSSMQERRTPAPPRARYISIDSSGVDTSFPSPEPLASPCECSVKTIARATGVTHSVHLGFVATSIELCPRPLSPPEGTSTASERELGEARLDRVAPGATDGKGIGRRGGRMMTLTVSRHGAIVRTRVRRHEGDAVARFRAGVSRCPVESAATTPLLTLRRRRRTPLSTQPQPSVGTSSRASSTQTRSPRTMRARSLSPTSRSRRSSRTCFRPPWGTFE